MSPSSNISAPGEPAPNEGISVGRGDSLWVSTLKLWRAQWNERRAQNPAFASFLNEHDHSPVVELAGRFNLQADVFGIGLPWLDLSDLGQGCDHGDVSQSASRILAF